MGCISVESKSAKNKDGMQRQGTMGGFGLCFHGCCSVCRLRVVKPRRLIAS